MVTVEDTLLAVFDVVAVGVTREVDVVATDGGGEAHHVVGFGAFGGAEACAVVEGDVVGYVVAADAEATDRAEEGEVDGGGEDLVEGEAGGMFKAVVVVGLYEA